MDVDKVAQPRDSGPRFFWIPAPVMSPRLFGPDGAHQHAQGDAGSAGVDHVIGHMHEPIFVGNLFLSCQEVDGDQRYGAQDGVGEHVDNNVGGKPRTFNSSTWLGNKGYLLFWKN